MAFWLRVALWIGLAASASAGVSGLLNHFVFRPAQSREDVYVAFKAGSLHPIDGVIHLPPEWASASVDGNAYVTRESARTSWLLFLKSRGGNHQFTGYLFCTQPAKTDVKGMIDLNYPTDSSPVTARVVRAQNPWSFEVVNDRP